MLRTAAHAKLRLTELRDLLEDAEAFCQTAEAAGAKAAPGVRAALQQQCKAFLDALHSRTMAHLSGARRWLVYQSEAPACAAPVL